MPFSELQRIVHKLYGPALALRSYLPHEQRRAIERILALTTALLFALLILSFALTTTVFSASSLTPFLGHVANKIAGFFFLSFSLAYIFTALEAFHRSYYFHGLEQILQESGHPEQVLVGWGVATIVAETSPDDVVRAFLESGFGQEILYRAGIPEKVFGEFFSKRKNFISTASFFVEKDGPVTLATYAKSAYKQDEEFRSFLATSNVNIDQLLHAAQWVTQIERANRQKARFWSRDNLGRIPGIGKTWGYGETYLLERYGHDLTEDHMWQAALMGRHSEQDEVEDMEQILSRARQANVLVVGDDPAMIRQRVAQLYHKIREGAALPPLESKRIFLLDVESVVTATHDKTAFEVAIHDILTQAIHAGNIVVYLERFPASVASATTIGVDLVDVLMSYFQSDAIQIILATDGDGFNTHLSRDTRLMQTFDIVRMKDISNDGLLMILEERALLREHQTGVVFTIPALDAIGRLADRYFPNGVMPDKAFDLLEELVPAAISGGIVQLVQADVEQLVYRKTGVPMGDPTQEERTKLLTLEDFLHKRVIGQQEAVSAVAKALRRARAGVENANKPMGSFLFLGPTGVGKTETAKALAEALFNDEDAMNRLDMTEFQGEDAVEELIGSFETNKPGRLAVMIREKQYGVLLLDEFEKSNRNVHNLFLQVLDEGMFTDAAGKSVNARNLIIIATSNAGAGLIWQWEKDGKDIAELKPELVDHLVKDGLFKPEFLNRFDEIVLFHPLKKDEIRAIAKIQLDSFAKHLLSERNITMTITDELIDAIAAIGYDPKFGGRPMRRAIKNKVEQAVADRILQGKLAPGGTLELTAQDVK
jgi:ATP-dependent Clp protease ATP-binding subunit ClpC